MALVLAVLFLVLSAVVSASEIAFFSLSDSDMDEVEEEKRPSDRKILRLKADSERLFATMLISNNVANVAVIMLLNFFFQRTVDFGGHDWLGFLIVTVVLIILILLLGDIMPKIYFSQHALRFCRVVSPMLIGLEKLFWPLASMLVRTRALATKVAHKESRSISVDELEQALELTDKKDIA